MNRYILEGAERHQDLDAACKMPNCGSAHSSHYGTLATYARDMTLRLYLVRSLSYHHQKIGSTYDLICVILLFPPR